MGEHAGTPPSLPSRRRSRRRCSMALKETSKNGFVFPRSENPKGAFLADFDIDGAKLKQDHKDWLDENVVKPATAKGSTAGGWHIELAGRASKSGSDGHNMWLSDQRVRAVQSYLDSKMAGLPFMFIPRVLGESAPIDAGEYENQLDRSVEVIAKFISVKPPIRRKPHILIPKVHPWKRPVNRKVQDFKLQVMKAKITVFTIDFTLGPLSVGNGTATVKMLIRIDEVGTTDEALYEFSATGPGTVVGAGFSIGKIKPGIGASEYGATYKAGNNHPFATDVEMDAGDFGGPAIFKFGAFGRALRFGPKDGLFGKQERIGDLSFGLGDEDFLKYAEGVVAGEMEVVTSTPEWAK